MVCVVREVLWREVIEDGILHTQRIDATVIVSLAVSKKVPSALENAMGGFGYVESCRLETKVGDFLVNVIALGEHLLDGFARVLGE